MKSSVDTKDEFVEQAKVCISMLCMWCMCVVLCAVCVVCVCVCVCACACVRACVRACVCVWPCDPCQAVERQDMYRMCMLV